MLVLMLCAVLSEWFQPGVITQTPQSLFTHSERTYKESPVNILGQTFISVFRIGTLGMACCTGFWTDGDCSFIGFCAVCGIILAVLLVKTLCTLLLDYTFMLSRYTDSPYEHYGNISTLAILALYPALMTLRFFDHPHAGIWVLGAVTLLFILMWTFRCWRMFVNSPKAVVYLLVYMGTLEVLPLALLSFLSYKTISIL